MKGNGGRLLALLLLLAGCLQDSGAPPTDPPAPVSEPRSFVTFVFEIELGTIEVLPYSDAAPETVQLMSDYVTEGYYVGREFNRVVPGHVIQVVDKAGGTTDDPRRVPLETHEDYHFSAGAVGIARGAEPDSGGPEFFIMDFATSHLDGNYTVWGQVVNGMDVVRRAARVQAVQGSQVPVGGDFLIDRMAVDAVAITAARMGSVTLSAEVAAGYPLVVAKNVRLGDFRHSLDWPRTLAPGVPTDLTWYMRLYNETRPPSADDVMIRVDGSQFQVSAADTHADGVYRWRWTPSHAVDFNATLLVGGVEVTTLTIPVGPK